ncbi:MAG: aminotransferase class V-fold PLP-dependent enzyme [Chloroflexi bacterium]|nr:MAG: aminotransferase class V-fold PLP-dependent enzyme [Chloroflexota bacterium]
MQNDFIYLDHAAATPVDQRVVAAMQPYFTDAFFNPSSPYAPALAVRREYEAAKQVIASAIGAKGDELVMTAGATESINLAFQSIGGHIVTAVIEHHAVIEAAKQFDHTFVSVNPQGRVDTVAIAAAIRPDTRLVSIALANNELGTVQPLRDIAEIIKKERERRLSSGDTTPIYLHSDASQGVGQIDVNVARLGVDLLTLNAGKVYGPKQMGLLWVHVSFPGVDAERLIFALEMRGVMVATGSACAANKGTRSHVLTAIGLTDDVADGSLRITLGKLSTQENCDLAAHCIIQEVQREQQRVRR